MKQNQNENFAIDIQDEEKDKSGFEVCGDLFFRLINVKNNSQICRFALNTSFVNEETNVYEFTKTAVDPDSIANDKRFDNDFKIKVFFKDCCSVCKPQNPVADLCQKCCSKIKKEKIEEWEKIRKIVDEHHLNIKAMTNDKS